VIQKTKNDNNEQRRNGDVGRFNHFQWEINLCLQKQYPLSKNPTDDEMLIHLKHFSQR